MIRLARVFVRVERQRAADCSPRAIDRARDPCRFKAMPTRLRGVWLGLLLVAGAATACRERAPGRGNETAGEGPSPPPAAPVGRAEAVAWDTAAGFYFAVPADRASHAFLIDTRYASSSELDTLAVDTGSFQGEVLDLLAAGQRLGTARIGAFATDSADGCAGWPLVEVAPLATPAAPVEWTVAFPTERVRTVAHDSLPALSSRDSARRVVALARAASVLSGDTAVAFRGRPFVVRQASRVAFPGREVVVAEVTRSVQQEADPQHEQLLLVLERPDSLSAAYDTRYHERAIAFEEALESVELVAGLVVARTGTMGLLLRRESERGMVFMLLERAADGAWQVRWRSAASC